MKPTYNKEEKSVLFRLCLEVEKKEPSREVIVQTVSDFFDIPLDVLQSPKKKDKIVHPRQIAMYLTEKLTKLTLKENAGYFGGRDHSTAIHSIQKVEDFMDTDVDYINNLIQIVQRINGYFYGVSSQKEEDLAVMQH